MSFSIIVPVKNQYKIVKMCLDSIVTHYSDQEMILVDDGSTELQTIDLLKSYSNCKYHRNEISKGHSFSCEAGIDLATNENVFLLNSDTILTKNCLYILDKVLSNDKVAVVGPSTSSASGPQLIKEAFDNRFVWTIDQIEQYALKLEQDQGMLDLDLINGFCLGIKKSVFESVGKFDPALTCYGNEKELLIRIRKSGYRTVWVMGCYVHHFGKMSYSKENLNVGVAQRDADRWILKKHGASI